MVFSLEQRVQREHAYAIIDEVDSILIDEARTPLIISGPVGNEADDKYASFNRQVAELVRKQTGVVNTLLAEAERLLEDEKTRQEAALKLYQAQLGMPKNKRLLKMLNETGIKQLVQRMELDAIADRKLPIRQQRMRDVEDILYFVLDEKGHSVHLTDQGAATMSPNDPALTTGAAKSGPRHFIWDKAQRHVYLLDELDAGLHVYAWDAARGTLQLKQSTTVLPAGFDGKPWAADLHLTPDGRYLYASERTSSTLSGFKVDAATGRLQPLGQTPTEKTPRGFAIDPSGRFLIAVGQESHSASVYPIDTASGALGAPLPRPRSLHRRGRPPRRRRQR